MDRTDRGHRDVGADLVVGVGPEDDWSAGDGAPCAGVCTEDLRSVERLLGLGDL